MKAARKNNGRLHGFMAQMTQKQRPRISIALLAGSILAAAYFLHWWMRG
jgi:hypothetical protein